MKQIAPILATLALLVASPVQADSCYADYKAKRNNPLKLHYGVASLSGPCTKKAAKAELAPRLSAKGWVLLNVVSVFDDNGLERRKDNAGRFYLRF